MQARNPINAKGIDISHWQGKPDFKKVKAAGYSFVFLKASQGTGYEDPTFATNLKNAKDANLLVGAYHFIEPSSTSGAINEANHFISIIKKNGGFSVLDLPPVLDIETANGQSKANMTKIARAFIDTVKLAANQQPMLYSYTSFLNSFIDGSQLSDCLLWIARYGKKQPENAGGFSSWEFLQYSDNGVVPGIANDNVDHNEFNGDETLLIKKYGNYHSSESTNNEGVNKMETWKVNMAETAIDALAKKGIISDPSGWKRKVANGTVEKDLAWLIFYLADAASDLSKK